MKTLTAVLFAIATLGLTSQLTACQTASPKKDCCAPSAPDKGCCPVKTKASCCDKPGAAGEGHAH